MKGRTEGKKELMKEERRKKEKKSGMQEIFRLGTYFQCSLTTALNECSIMYTKLYVCIYRYKLYYINLGSSTRVYFFVIWNFILSDKCLRYDIDIKLAEKRTNLQHLPTCIL